MNAWVGGMHGWVECMGGWNAWVGGMHGWNAWVDGTHRRVEGCGMVENKMMLVKNLEKNGDDERK